MIDQKKLDLAVDFTVKEHERIRHRKAIQVSVYSELEDYDAVGLRIHYEDGGREVLLLDPLNLHELGTLLAEKEGVVGRLEKAAHLKEESWVTLDTMKELV